MYWTLEDEDWNETGFYLNFSYEYWDRSETPDCWGEDYDYYMACLERGEGGGMEMDWYYGSFYEWYYYGEDWSVYAA